MQKISYIAKTATLALALLTASANYAQTTDALGTYTPYSIFGIGDIAKQGTALNRGMGGIGVGLSTNKFINHLNPASIVNRDTLSFMLDFGVEQKNIYNSNGNLNSAYNVFNMHNLIITAPIMKKSALIMGITQFSDVGYKFEKTETDPLIVSQMGDVKYQIYGTGGISKAFIGGAYGILPGLSLGLEGVYYFGTIDRNSAIIFNSSSDYRNIVTGFDYIVGAFSGKLGVQYSKTFENSLSLTAGATYSLKTKLKGDMTRFSMSESVSGVIDTMTFVVNKDTKLDIPAELAFGFTLSKNDKWLIGADYIRQDWSKSNFASNSSIAFKPVVSNSYRIGGEYTPNRFDIRYFLKRCTYRAGLYYENTYMNVAGKQINSMGITLGMSLPIYQLNNAIGVAVDFGQRGSLKNNLVRERYVNFVINIHLHDIWFQKFRYD